LYLFARFQLVKRKKHEMSEFLDYIITPRNHFVGAEVVRWTWMLQIALSSCGVSSNYWCMLLMLSSTKVRAMTGACCPSFHQAICPLQNAWYNMHAGVNIIARQGQPAHNTQHNPKMKNEKLELKTKEKCALTCWKKEQTQYDR
jgi:hypothetical protein